MRTLLHESRICSGGFCLTLHQIPRSVLSDGNTSPKSSSLLVIALRAESHEWSWLWRMRHSVCVKYAWIVGQFWLRWRGGTTACAEHN